MENLIKMHSKLDVLLEHTCPSMPFGLVENLVGIKFIGSFSNGKNMVYEISMPDGNKFRYSWGKMIRFAGNNEGNNGQVSD